MKCSDLFLVRICLNTVCSVVMYELLCLLTPLTLVCGGVGVRSSRFWSTIQLISLHLASSSITPVGSVHKSRGDSVVHMLVQFQRWCVSWVWVLQRGHSGCSLLMLVEDARGDRRSYRRGIFQSRSHNCFIGSHECLFTPSCCSECFYDL